MESHLEPRRREATKERKPESAMRPLPRFPSQLRMCLMLEKINSVITIKKKKSDFYHRVWLKSDSFPAHKSPEKDRTEKQIPSPRIPCPQRKRRAKSKCIWLETIWSENNNNKKKITKQEIPKGEGRKKEEETKNQERVRAGSKGPGWAGGSCTKVFLHGSHVVGSLEVLTLGERRQPSRKWLAPAQGTARLLVGKKKICCRLLGWFFSCVFVCDFVGFSFKLFVCFFGVFCFLKEKYSEDTRNQRN